MPANSFSGNRDVVAVVNALSSWDFDRTVTYAEVINVPSGGTLLQLPDNPRDGDYYEWANPDNTVTALDPIELALSAAAITAGVTIQRAASQLFTTPGTSGKVVFFDEANTWQLFLSASGGGGGGGATILNVTTTAMTGGSGQAAYLAGSGAATPTDATTYAPAVFAGVYEGVAGEIQASGLIPDAQFTTAGGSPADGANVFLALASVDGGTAAGKFSAVAPSTVGQAVSRVGVCVSSANYAAHKTCSVMLQPATAIQL